MWAAVAMTAYVARFGSSWSHFSILRPNPIVSLNTRGLCHMIAVDSGTRPTIFRIASFSTPP
jgi:hypothetical protein